MDIYMEIACHFSDEGQSRFLLGLLGSAHLNLPKVMIKGDESS